MGGMCGLDWDGDGFRPPRLGVGDMANYHITISILFFFYITILDYFTILCHVGFSIFLVV